MASVVGMGALWDRRSDIRWVSRSDVLLNGDMTFGLFIHCTPNRHRLSQCEFVKSTKSKMHLFSQLLFHVGGRSGFVGLGGCHHVGFGVGRGVGHHHAVGRGVGHLWGPSELLLSDPEPEPDSDCHGSHGSQGSVHRVSQ